MASPNVNAAMAFARANPALSTRRVARGFGVSPCTLARRLRGTSTSAREAMEGYQLLSPDLEKELTEWVLDMARDLRPPTKILVRQFAGHLAGQDHPLGESWCNAFFRRNPTLALRGGKRVEDLRVRASTVENIEYFDELLAGEIAKYDIRPCDIYNMDEVGISTGTIANTRGITHEVNKRACQRLPNKGPWITVLECVSADGKAIPPAVIFDGERIQSTWLSDDPVLHEKARPWLCTTSKSGYTSNELGYQWLRDHFEPKTRTEGRWRLLILDGQESHRSAYFLWLAKINRIRVLFLPPHTSHVLQPLDVSIFGPVKSRYRTEVRHLVDELGWTNLAKRHFVSFYAEAREAVLIPSTIRTGFRLAGIHPRDKSLPLSRLPQLSIPPRPTTPSALVPPQRTLQRTPQNTPRTIREFVSAITALSPSRPSRERRRVKAAIRHGVDRLSLDLVRAQEQLRRTQYEVEELRQGLRPRRAVTRVDPNALWHSVTEIEAAQELEKMRGKKRKRPETDDGGEQSVSNTTS